MSTENEKLTVLDCQQWFRLDLAALWTDNTAVIRATDDDASASAAAAAALRISRSNGSGSVDFWTERACTHATAKGFNLSALTVCYYFVSSWLHLPSVRAPPHNGKQDWYTFIRSTAPVRNHIFTTKSSPRHHFYLPQYKPIQWLSPTPYHV